MSKIMTKINNLEQALLNISECLTKRIGSLETSATTAKVLIEENSDTQVEYISDLLEMICDLQLE